MRGKIAAIALAGVLAGCGAGFERSMEYNSTKHVVLQDPSLPHAFWVFDKPRENRMLVNVGAGAAAGQGLVRGATLGLADTSTAHQHFERAAQLFLDKSSRPCKVDRSERILSNTNYEVFYSCETAETSATE